MTGEPETLETPRSQLGAILCVGLLVCAAFSVIARFYGPDGHAAPPQHDSLMYQQYARSMAEGHPYRYNPGDPPSTGSTSHLYPAVLALLYRAGARGDALPSAGFVLGALCYLGFLLLFWKASRLIAPESATLACWLCVLSGHTAVTALGQSDMGLFMVLVMGALVAALAHRPVVCGLILVAVAWCRPEGAILSGLLMLIGLARVRLDGRRAWGLAGAGLAGVIAFGGVLVLNYRLTGTTAFQSVLSKPPSLFYPPLEVAYRALRSLGDFVSEAAFGVGPSTDRRFLILPVAGGALALCGMASRWRAAGPTASGEVWWVASAGATLVLVALSDWIGFFHDRYLGWIVPIGFVYAAVGVHAFARRFAPAGAAVLLGGALIAFQCVGLAYYAVVYAQDCAQLQVRIDFARKVNDRLPPGTVVGTSGRSGFTYYMPDLVTLNINGVTSPAFAQRRHFVSALEVFKHRPELRCNAWFVPPSEAKTAWFSDVVGDDIALSTAALGEENAMGLYAARWDLLDYPPEPLSPEVVEKVQTMQIVDRLDVGYADDEIRTGYTAHSRVLGAFIHPLSKTAEVGPAGEAAADSPPALRKICDVGRVIYGYETFHVKCLPGRPMRVVARLALRASGLSNFPRSGMRPQNFEFVPPLRIRPFVNGKELAEQSLAAESGTNDFLEMVFDVPAEYLKSPRADITIGADHIAFGYWFYQKSE